MLISLNIITTSYLVYSEEIVGETLATQRTNTPEHRHLHSVQSMFVVSIPNTVRLATLNKAVLEDQV